MSFLSPEVEDGYLRPGDQYNHDKGSQQASRSSSPGGPRLPADASAQSSSRQPVTSIVLKDTIAASTRLKASTTKLLRTFEKRISTITEQSAAITKQVSVWQRAADNVSRASAALINAQRHYVLEPAVERTVQHPAAADTPHLCSAADTLKASIAYLSTCPPSSVAHETRHNHEKMLKDVLAALERRFESLMLCGARASTSNLAAYTRIENRSTLIDRVRAYSFTAAEVDELKVISRKLLGQFGRASVIEDFSRLAASRVSDLVNPVIVHEKMQHAAMTESGGGFGALNPLGLGVTPSTSSSSTAPYSPGSYYLVFISKLWRHLVKETCGVAESVFGESCLPYVGSELASPCMQLIMQQDVIVLDDDTGLLHASTVDSSKVLIALDCFVELKQWKESIPAAAVSQCRAYDEAVQAMSMYVRSATRSYSDLLQGESMTFSLLSQEVFLHDETVSFVHMLKLIVTNYASPFYSATRTHPAKFLERSARQFVECLVKASGPMKRHAYERHLFVCCNAYYVHKAFSSGALSSSESSLDWRSSMRSLEEIWRAELSSFVTDAWASMTTIAEPVDIAPGYQPLTTDERRVAKRWFLKFASELEERVRAHRRISISPPALQPVVIKAVVDRVVSCYKETLRRLGGRPFTTHTEKYRIYTPEHVVTVFRTLYS